MKEQQAGTIPAWFLPCLRMGSTDNPRGVTAPAEGTERSQWTQKPPQSSFIVAASLGHAREPAQLEERRRRRVVVGEELPEQGARPCPLVLPGQHSSCSLALGRDKSDS